MKRLLVLGIIAACLIATPAHASSRTEGRWRGPCEGWFLGENLTPAIYNADTERAQLMMRRLITCVFAKWAPGQSITALYVAQRESGLYPWAQNPSSGCSGLFQHIASAWPGRRDAYIWRGWFGPNAWPMSVFDPRANSIAAARMVAAGGWGPWGM